MRNTTVKCRACGWWDLGMKYGSNTRCTRCGMDLYSAAGTEGRLAFDKTLGVRDSRADNAGIEEED